MVKKINYIKTQKTELYIDSLTFDKPKSSGEMLSIGFLVFCILVTSPLWIWFYLLGKVFQLIAKERKVDNMEYICPNCGSRIGEINMGHGNLFKIECGCGWEDYLDIIDKKIDVTKKFKAASHKN